MRNDEFLMCSIWDIPKSTDFNVILEGTALARCMSIIPTLQYKVGARKGVEMGLKKSECKYDENRVTQLLTQYLPRLGMWQRRNACDFLIAK